MKNKTKNHSQHSENDRVIALAFPPYFDCTEPYLALPTLTGFLRHKGLNVEQRDLNLEWYEEWMNAEALRGYENNLLAIRDNPRQARKRRWRAALALTILPFVCSHLEEAKKVLRHSTRLRSLEWSEETRYAWKMVQAARDIYAAPYWPTQLEHYIYENPTHKNHKLHQVLAAVRNASTNLFQSFLTEKVAQWDLTDRFLVFGISIASVTQMIPAFTLAKIVKEYYPEMPVVIGGALLPYMRRAIENIPEAFDWVDYYVVGEGETAIYRLSNYLLGKGELVDVPNLLYRDNDKVRFTFTHVENVDEVPSPDFTGIVLKEQFNLTSASLLGARGCYWDKCAFCSLCNNFSHNYRARNIDLVMNDLEKLISEFEGLEYVAFLDESISPVRLSQICDALESRGLAGKVHFQMLARLEKGFTIELLTRAYSAGFRWISWGLESASPATLQRMRKGISPAAAEECLRAGHSAGLWNHIFVMWYFPGDTVEDMNKTIDFVKRNAEYLDSVVASEFIMEENSYVHLHPEKFNLTVDPLPSDNLGTLCTFKRTGSDFDYKNVKARVAAFDRYLLSNTFGVLGLLFCDDFRLSQVLHNGHWGKQQIRRVMRRVLERNKQMSRQAAHLKKLTLQADPQIQITSIKNNPLADGHDIVIFNPRTRGFVVCNHSALKIVTELQHQTCLVRSYRC